MVCTKNVIVTLLLCVIFFFGFVPVNRKSVTSANNADWLRHAKFGVMVHYLEQLQNERQPWNQNKKTSWDSCVNDFDVNLFAKQIHSIGAGYVIFTTQQASKYFCLPNAAFENISGYKRGEATTQRDLIADLYNALSKYNIRLILYVTGDGTSRDYRSSVALQSPVLRLKQTNNKFLVNQTWVNNWSKILNDISLRYGQKIAGWWVDGAYPFIGYNDSLLGILSRSLKAGNPNSIVAFNPSPQPAPVYYSKWDDYTAGEVNNPMLLPPDGGKVKGGVQWHELSYLGKSWQNDSIRFSKDTLVNYINNVNRKNGIVSLEVALFRNGSIAPAQLDFLKKVSESIASR